MNSSDIINAISKAYISVIQDITQGSFSVQVLKINCGGNSDICAKCKRLEAKLSKTTKDTTKQYTKKMCSSICSCEIRNINMNYEAKLNLSSALTSDSKAKFMEEVKNNLYTEAYQKDSHFFVGDGRQEQLQKTIESLWTTISDSTFQNSVQDLSSIQLVEFTGGGIYNIDVQQTIDFVSAIIISNQSIMDTISQIEKDVLLLSKQVINAGLAELIEIIVKIVMLLVIFILVLYFGNLAFTFLGLYAE